MGKNTVRELSKDREWSVEGATWENINVGSLQRIADAVEKMVAPHDAQRRRVAWLEDDRKRLIAENERLARSNAALRGVVRRMKGVRREKA